MSNISSAVGIFQHGPAVKPLLNTLLVKFRWKYNCAKEFSTITFYWLPIALAPSFNARYYLPYCPVQNGILSQSALTVWEVTAEIPLGGSFAFSVSQSKCAPSQQRPVLLTASAGNSTWDPNTQLGSAYHVVTSNNNSTLGTQKFSQGFIKQNGIQFPLPELCKLCIVNMNKNAQANEASRYEIRHMGIWRWTSYSVTFLTIATL